MLPVGNTLQRETADPVFSVWDLKLLFSLFMREQNEFKSVLSKKHRLDL